MKGIVWLASYPKSGNTWFRAFLSNLNHGGDQPVDINAFDYTNFASRTAFERVLGWESSDLTLAELEEARIPVQEAYGREGTAVFKVHEAFTDPRTGSLQFSREATRGALYFIRNPLDVAVSFSYHRGKDLDNTIARMANPVAVMAASKDGLDLQLPQPLGTWSYHVLSWVDRSAVPVQVMRYEDMLARPQEVFSAACRFAGFPHDSERVARALRHSSFEVLQQQEAAQGFRESAGGRAFFRKGQAGTWREVLSEEQVSAIVREHGEVMWRFGYLNADGTPVLS
jgi:hypothetical protein